MDETLPLFPGLPAIAPEPEVEVNHGGADFSEDRLYRWKLWRRWSMTKEMCTFIMLNPSNANETAYDPTLGRVIGFARASGYGGVRIVNLYSWVDSSPDCLWDGTVADPVGIETDQRILWACQGVSRVVVAWGRVPTRAGPRVQVIKSTLARLDIAPWCLGHNKDGSPKHPLYLHSDTALEPWGQTRPL